MKRAALFFSIMLIITAFAGCSDAETPDPADGNRIQVAAMNGPTMMGLAKLRDRTENDDPSDDPDNEYTFSSESGYDNISAGLAAKTYDAAALPCNNAAAFSSRGNIGISVAAVNTLNVLYIVEAKSSSDIHTLADLAGKTVYSPGLAGTPEAVVKYLLTKNNITNVNLQYSLEPADIVAGLAGGTVKYAVLPQPAATSAVMGGASIRINLIDEWKKIEGNADKEIVTGVLVVRNAYLKNNKATFDKFLDEYRESAEFMTAPENLDTAAQYVVDLGIMPKLAAAKQALPQCAVTFVEGGDMKSMVSGFLEILYGQNKDAVGGKLPGEEFYYFR